MTNSLPQSPDSPHGTARCCAFAPLLRSVLVFAATALLASAISYARPQPTLHKTPHHRRTIAKKAATLQPAPPAAPVAPPKPNWPANDPPAPPQVTYNSKGLQIVANNSSLSSILNQVSVETGARVQGLSGDERVFGEFGPGQPRNVLGDLLSGVNYNVLILGDEARGEPLKVMLSPRPNGPAPPPSPQAQDQGEDYPEPQPYQPPYQPPVQPPNQPPFNNRPMTPQERLQILQERQHQFQEQQQLQQQEQQQPR